MASSTSNGEGTANVPPVSIIDIPDVARPFQARKEWIVKERIYAIQAYAGLSMRKGGIPQETVQTKAWLERIDRLLKLHEYDFEISTRMRDAAKIDIYLKFMFDDPRFHFPKDIQDRAKALYEEYEACDWTTAASDEDIETADMGVSTPAGLDGNDDSTATAPSAGNASTQAVTVKLPPENDPIWGVNGIMHGIAPKFGKAKVFVIDRRYLNEKRSANVFGHNGLEPGAWFPNQIAALFHGGHGARMAGVHGTRMAGVHGKVGVGAYSVVVSGAYKDVDNDNGDTIIYSGPGSSTNTDKYQIPKGSAQILAHSLPSSTGLGHPVRVFRSAASHELSPGVGIRYDGLYHIGERLPEQTNEYGGLYCRFVLRRVPGQESLASICARSPTLQQKRDHARIWNLRF